MKCEDNFSAVHLNSNFKIQSDRSVFKINKFQFLFVSNLHSFDNKMNHYSRHTYLQLIAVSAILQIVWSYRESGHYGGPGQREYTKDIYKIDSSFNILYPHFIDVPFGSIESGIRNDGNCPLARPFPPNAGKVTDNVAYECLPSYLRNRNAVLDEDDGTTEWAGGRKPDYSVVDEMFIRGKENFFFLSTAPFYLA